MEESALEESTESLLSLSLRAQELKGRGEPERGGEEACRGGLLLGAAILRDKLRQMGSPPRAKSSSASDPNEAESLSCKDCINGSEISDPWMRTQVDRLMTSGEGS